MQLAKVRHFPFFSVFLNQEEMQDLPVYTPHEIIFPRPFFSFSLRRL